MWVKLGIAEIRARAAAFSSLTSFVQVGVLESFSHTISITVLRVNVLKQMFICLVGCPLNVVLRVCRGQQHSN